VTSANAPAIAEICYRLDGLPLAIELAAARMKLLSAQALLDRLERRLPLLTGGARDLPARQQTIRNTIAWSFDLLSPDEQQLIQQLSVFAGGWTLEAAAAITGQDDLTVLDVLASLVDKSLVQQQGAMDSPTDIDLRFGMLEMVREFALEQLEQSGIEDDIRARHARFFADLVERADPELRGPGQPVWFQRLTTEQDNLRAALRWSLMEEHDPDPGLRIAAGLPWYWFTSDQFREGRDWLELAFERASGVGQATRAAIQLGLGMMWWRLNDMAEALPLVQSALVTYQDAGDLLNAAFALHQLAHVLDDDGQPERAVETFEESIRRMDEIGNAYGIAFGRSCLARSLLAQGQVGRARELIELALPPIREAGDPWSISVTLHRFGDVALAQGDLEASRQRYQESLGLAARKGDDILIADALLRLAQIGTALGQLDMAARMFGGAEVIHEEHGVRLYGPLRPGYEQAVAQLRAGLGDERFARCWSEGQGLPRETLIMQAMQRGQS
jgi:tetratricopeptide (TPR) repeat protein